VHVHNLAMGEHDRDYRFGDDYVSTQSDTGVTFSGIVRPDGRVATRNYLGVLSSVNCSATVVRAIADTFTYRPELLAEFPNIDGVVGLNPTGPAARCLTALDFDCCAAPSPGTPVT